MRLLRMLMPLSDCLANILEIIPPNENEKIPLTNTNTVLNEYSLIYQSEYLNRPTTPHRRNINGTSTGGDIISPRKARSIMIIITSVSRINTIYNIISSEIIYSPNMFRNNASIFSSLTGQYNESIIFSIFEFGIRL